MIRTTRQARHERRAHKTYDAADRERQEGETQFHTNMDNNCPGQEQSRSGGERDAAGEIGKSTRATYVNKWHCH